MACIDNIICLGTFCSCGNITITELISPITGQIRMEAEFNNSLITRNISVSNGSPISVPNVFNENYTHIVSFYVNNELLNDAFYSIKIVNCINTENLEPMPFEKSSIIIEAEAGNTIVNGIIAYNFVTAVMIDDVTKNTGYTVSGNTLTFTDGTILDNGQTVTIFFE